MFWYHAHALHLNGFHIGGPGAAHEAEQFTWSDHTVIPIKCTEGAAGGKFNVPQKIFEVRLYKVNNNKKKNSASYITLRSVTQ